MLHNQARCFRVICCIARKPHCLVHHLQRTYAFWKECASWQDDRQHLLMQCLWLKQPSRYSVSLPHSGRWDGFPEVAPTFLLWRCSSRGGCARLVVRLSSHLLFGCCLLLLSVQVQALVRLARIIFAYLCLLNPSCRIPEWSCEPQLCTARMPWHAQDFSVHSQRKRRTPRGVHGIASTQ